MKLKPDISSGAVCASCLLLFFCIMTVFTFWVFISMNYVELLDDVEGDHPFILETDRLPMISSDKKSIFVVSEEGLPIANNFIMRNPSIPIEKIVYRKPGVNSSIHVYPIQRDALNHDFYTPDVPALCLVIIFVVFLSLGLYFLMCRELCYLSCFFPYAFQNDPHYDEITCDNCFDFDPNHVYGDSDDYSDSSFSDSSACNSPIKQKKKGGIKDHELKMLVMEV